MARHWGPSRFNRRHLSEETILLHLDGVLEGQDDEKVTRHLRECWHCRAVRERLEEAIGAFMEERREQLRILEAHPAGAGDFRSRLSRHAASRAAEKPRSRSSVLLSMKRALWPLAAAAAALAAAGGWPPVRDFVLDLVATERSIEAPASHIPVRLPFDPDPTLIAPAAVAPPPAVPVLSPPQVIAGPTAAELDAAELTAYLTVHELGLCRGGAVEIRRIPGEGILVTGVADHRERAGLLTAQLAGFDYIRTRLAVAGDDLPPAPEEADAMLVLSARPPLLEDRLKEHFRRHSPADRVGRDLAEFSSQTVRLASATHTEAQALRTLTTVFTLRRVQAMRPADHARFTRAVNEHLDEFRQGLAQLESLLDRLDPQDPPLFPGMAAGLAPEYDWGVQLERLAARIDSLAGGLFAGLDLHGPDGDAAWVELRQICRRLDSWLKHDAVQATSGWLESGVVAAKPAKPESR